MVNVPVKLDDAGEGEGNDEGQEPTNEVKQPTYSVGEMKLQMLDPHDVLHYVHTQLGLTVQPESVRSYWRQAKANGAGWAIVQDNLDAIPVGIYADETKYGLHESQEKILAVFLNLVLFRPKNIRLSRFLLCSIRSKFLLPGTDTLIPIFNRIVWSMGWAAKGFFPTSGLLGAGLSSYQEALSGKPLGGKFFVTELRGDLAWHKLIWSISDGWASTNMCFFCHAKSTGRQRHLYYTCAGENASWRATIFRDTLPWVYNKLDLNKLCF